MRPAHASEVPGLGGPVVPAARELLSEGGPQPGAKTGPVFERVVFRTDDAEFTVKDVLDTAWVRGDLQPLWRQLLESLACQQRADELAQEAEDVALQAMSEEFRYERQLLTPEETEHWLAARDLTEDDFGDYFLRRFWREHSKEPVAPEDLDLLEAPPELLNLLRAELLLSGEFDRLAQALSWRLVAHDTTLDTPDSTLAPRPSTPVTISERAHFLEQLGLNEATLPDALQHLGRDLAWFDQSLRLEAAYRIVCDRCRTDEKRAGALAARRLALTRVQVETIVLRSLEAAQEAILCAREDQLPLDELAQQCGVACQRSEWFLEDGPPDLQQTLLSASPGEILGPHALDGQFAVHRLAAKSPPDLNQPDVRTRIDRRLLETHFAELTGKRIRWVLPTGSASGRGAAR